VLTANGDLAGIFTERDFVVKILDANKRSDQVIIKDVMTAAANLIVADEDASLRNCRQILVDSNYRHLPILTRDGKPLG